MDKNIKKIVRICVSLLFFVLSLGYSIKNAMYFFDNFGYSYVTEVLRNIGCFLIGITGMEIATAGFVPELLDLRENLKEEQENNKNKEIKVDDIDIYEKDELECLKQDIIFLKQEKERLLKQEKEEEINKKNNIRVKK